MAKRNAVRPAMLAMIAVILIAFALRAYHLDYQSLWSDEGISLLRSSQPLAEMLRTMPVEHMPGYFVLLHSWLALAGESDFALRFLSLWPAVMAVAILYRLGADLGIRAAGLFAAILLATGAFQIWYAQEARMYSWLLATSLFSSLLLWRLLNGQTRRRWLLAIAYILATAATIYWHYYGFLVPLAQAIYVAGWLMRRRDWKGVGIWALVGGGVLLLFLPWLPRSLRIFEFSGWRQPGDPAEIPWRYLTAYTAGEAMPQSLQNWLPWLYLVLIGLGVFAWWRKRSAASLYLLSAVLIPLAVILALAVRNPDYHERYTIYLSGPLLLLAAGGILILDPGVWRDRPGQPENERRRPQIAYSVPALILLFGLVAANGVALQRLYEDSSLHKPDFRAAALRIQEQEQPGDVILVDGPDPQKAFLHYYKGDAPVYDLRPLQKVGNSAVEATLEDYTKDAERAWEVLYFHAPGPVQVWLATRAWSTPATYHNGIRVTLYDLPGEPLQEQALDLPYGPGLTLVKVEYEAEARRGQPYRVSTHWFVDQPLPEYKFSLRLQDHSGKVYLVDDYTPQNWFAPTNV